MELNTYELYFWGKGKDKDHLVTTIMFKAEEGDAFLLFEQIALANDGVYVVTMDTVDEEAL